MNVQKEFSTLAELIGKRSDKLYAWLRWLVLLAAGSFSLMAGQLSGRPFPAMQLVLLKTALAANAAGILFGAVALYGEVGAARQLATKYKEQIAHNLEGTEPAASGPVGGRPSRLSEIAERLCYACLASALVAWCAFVFAM